MGNKHGLYNAVINFTPICDQEIKKCDIIGSDDLEITLFCVEKDKFVIVSDAPMESFLSDEELKLKFKIL